MITNNKFNQIERELNWEDTKRDWINLIGAIFQKLTRFNIHKPRRRPVGWDGDVNSLYPWQQLGIKPGDKVVIYAGRGMGKSYFKEMYEGSFKDAEID